MLPFPEGIPEAVSGIPVVRLSVLCGKTADLPCVRVIGNGLHDLPHLPQVIKGPVVGKERREALFLQDAYSEFPYCLLQRLIELHIHPLSLL